MVQVGILKKVCFIVIFIVVSSGLSFAQTLIKSVEVSNAGSIAVNPETNRIYVAGSNRSGSKSFISVIDGDTNEVIDVINIEGISFLRVAVNISSDLIYASNVNILSTLRPFDSVSFVTVIDGNTNEIIDTIGLSRIKPTSLIVNQITNKVYVTGVKGLVTKKMVIDVVDGGLNEFEDSLNLSKGFIFDAAINQETNRLYATEITEDRSGERKINVRVIDGETNSMIDVIEFGNITNGGLAIDENTNKIYLAETINFTSNDINDLMTVVNVIDGETNEVTDVIELDSTFISSVTVNSETNKIYTGTMKIGDDGFARETIEIIDGQTIVSIDVSDGELPASAPIDVAVNPVTNRIYTSILGGLVQVVQE